MSEVKIIASAAFLAGFAIGNIGMFFFIFYWSTAAFRRIKKPRHTGATTRGSVRKLNS